MTRHNFILERNLLFFDSSIICVFKKVSFFLHYREMITKLFLRGERENNVWPFATQFLSLNLEKRGNIIYGCIFTLKWTWWMNYYPSFLHCKQESVFFSVMMFTLVSLRNIRKRLTKQDVTLVSKWKKYMLHWKKLNKHQDDIYSSVCHIEFLLFDIW